MQLVTLSLFFILSLAQQQYQLRIGGNDAGVYQNGYIALDPSGQDNAIAVAKDSSSLTYTLENGILESVQDNGYFGYVAQAPNKALISFGKTIDTTWSSTQNNYLAYNGTSTFAFCNMSTVLGVLYLDNSVGSDYNAQPCTPAVIVLVPAGAAPQRTSSSSSSSMSTSSISGMLSTLSMSSTFVNAAGVTLSSSATATATTTSSASVAGIDAAALGQNASAATASLTPIQGGGISQIGQTTQATGAPLMSMLPQTPFNGAGRHTAGLTSVVVSMAFTWFMA